jgi:hypothetical protein
VLFCWCKFYFAGDKLLTTPNPDVNEDMKMFEMLGLNPQNLSQKVSTTNRWSWRLSICPLGEKNQNGQDQDIQLNEILKHLAKENKFRVLYHTNHLFKTGGFFYEVKLINYLPKHWQTILKKYCYQNYLIF